ncbi:MAG: amidohydrolase [Candidatus Competibacterales bacterium]
MSPFAELVLENGTLYTLEAQGRRATALAVKGNRIAAVGDADAVAPWIGPDTVRLDLAGRSAIPGIVDSHCHPDAYAVRRLKWLDLSPEHILDRDGLLAALKSRGQALPADHWLVGYRFDDTKSGGYPTMEELDAVADGRPLFVLRTDGHLGLANRAAFGACGIAPDAPDPPFGRYDRCPQTGALTGVVRETATHQFLRQLHRGDTPEEVAAGLEAVLGEFLSYGITTVYNSLTPRVAIDAYQRLREAGRLPLRVGIIASGREEGLIEALIQAGIRSGFGDDWLRLIGVEWCPDCSTSGRTAAYYAPYRGTPVPGEPVLNTGMLLYRADDLKGRAVAAHCAGLQVMIEGVGDRGIDFALDAIEACLAACPRPDHRMRVEHCCHVTPAILARLKALEVIDSSATGFMYDLGDAYVAHRGMDAMAYMWPHRTLIDAGVPAPGHSDAMVCRINPFTALWAMVNRKSDSGQSLDPRQAVTLEEALEAYTWLGAHSGREEHLKGGLAVGKLADIAVLDRDLTTLDDDEILDLRVDLTLVDGQVRYQRHDL